MPAPRRSFALLVAVVGILPAQQVPDITAMERVSFVTKNGVVFRGEGAPR